MMILILSIISAILYRAGGMAKEQKHWIPVWMRHSWVRDYLCPVCALLPVVLVYPSWWIILAYGLSVASLSTYWDRLFGYDNYAFSGFICGIAFFPLLFCGVGWVYLMLRALVLYATWGLICHFSDNDFVEEYSRGFSFTAAVIFLPL